MAADDIAIIGLALRFPGSDTLVELFDHLAAGRSLITEVPAERWSKERYFGDPRSGEEKTNSVWAGFIENADRFDAAFFNISPREAETMDPQQRFALELAWQAIEDAGYRAGTLAGSRTGVFMGVCHGDYAELIERDDVPTDVYFPTGTAYSIVANRLSYFFDFHGPSIANDTACSSSLVSLYEAVSALHNGDCDLALAGGVNLCWSPKLFVAFSKASMLSPTGTSHAFDEGADGFVRGEGGAVLLLKPLARAVADRDPVHAVIKSVGTNHGGKTNSLTVTNPTAQATLIEDVYTRAGIAPETVGYIEAHGPGTPVGDPIEILGLTRAFRNLHEANGTEPRPGSTGIGSVKTNIGHLESAAGVAGVVKVIGAMAAGTLPATVNFRTQNQLIDLDGSPFYIVGDTQPWPADEGTPRRAGVSSFGFGGTNAHVLLEEPTREEPAREELRDEPARAESAAEAPGPYVIPLSAKKPERLRALADQLRDHLRAPESALRPRQSLADIAHTLQVGREPMAARAVLVVADREQLVDALASVTDGEVHNPAEAGPDTVAAAEEWVRGGTADWPHDPEAHRVRLPTYPFARDRHWYRTPAAGTPDPAALHPLVHRNTSDLAQQRYTSTFTGSEPFLASHQVRGARVLPAVAYLEMARAAVESAATGDGAVRLRDVAWMRPIVVDEPVDVHIGLTPRGDTIAFEFLQGETTHSVGSAELVTVPEPSPLDLDALRASCATPRDPDEMYAQLDAQGLEYGPDMRALRDVWVGQDEALARIQTTAADGCVLPPSLLDAAFQTSVLLMGESTGPTLAFALDELQVHRPCPSETWAWVRRSGDSGALAKFDIDLCDRDGVISASLRGLAQRTTDAGPRVVTATTRWIDRATNPADGSRTTHSVTLPEIAPARPADGVEAMTEQVFAEVQQLLAAGPKGEHRFLALVDARVPAHLHAPLTGLFRTVALENPLVSGRIVRVTGLAAASPEQVARIVREEGADDSADTEVRYSADGTRQVREPVETQLGAGPRVPELRAGGVYWVTGGLGGIGPHLARYFGRAEATVVLSGRSTAGSVAALRAEGVDAHYLPVDVADAQAVRDAVATLVREHGSLDGVVHAAGVLRDQYLLRKDLADVPLVTAPKVRGTLNLDAATRHLDLDFFALFSSVASVYGNPGQSDYAAANAFLDAFAEHRQSLVEAGERSGRTVAVSWPLWADGGMTVDEVTRESMRRERGWQPLPTEDGLRAFGRSLLADAPAHLVVAYGAEATLGAARRAAPVPVASSGGVVEGDRAGAGDLQARAEDLLKGVVAEVLRHAPEDLESTTNLIEYGIDSLSILGVTAQLEKLFGPLSKTIFFEYLNIADVAAHFVESRREQLEAVLGKTEPAQTPEARRDTPAERPSAPATRFDDAAGPATARVREPASEPATAGASLRGARDDRHDIAIIGVSGRYPGADTMDELWELLENGRHTFEEIPADRWDHEAVHDSDRAVLGKSVIRTGTFLRDIDAFDPRYFRISKREAEQMSPEVRLFLQAGVQALEDAGYSKETIHRRYQGDVGVLVGTMSNHYNLYGFQNGLTRGAPQSGSYTGTIPNMLSYFYGLTGPSLFVDTMCSASSTCVHQAVQMLRAGECRMVVAGGINLMLHPYNLIASSQEHFTTGTSDVIRSFGRGVDGTILGEGVGAVVLKPLVDAERDGDQVYAVIKGTALSNAGTRNGFTVPNPGMQAHAIEKAVADAAVDPRTISYVEGHGSGTALGDPIEVRALTTAYRKHTPDRQFCALGSVKANMGHLLAAAGMIGLAKVLLQFRHGKLAPSLHSTELNPDIDFTDTPFRVQQTLADWQPPVTVVDGREVAHPRRAGITSIGAGGMNSHIILEEYPERPARREPFGEQLFVFSAMNEAALGRYLASFRDYLAGAPEADLPDIAFTLRVGKNELAHRWAFVAADKRSALAAVDGYLAGRRELPAHDLATTWVAGRSVDWDQLPTARRVSLPAYPFEKVRCWVEQTEGAPSVLAPLALRERLHPFLGRNASDVRGLRYATDVHLDDLLDYGYRRDKAPAVVPTFAVDLALATAKVSGFAAQASVHDLRVLRPVDWSATRRLVTEFADGHGVVRTDDGSAAVEFTVRAATPPSGRIDLAGLRQVRTREQFLAELADGGLDYKPASCAVDGVFRTPDERTVLRVGRPAFQQDHARRNVTVEPHVLAALAQGVQWEARRAGAPDWARTALNHVAEIHVRAGVPVAHVLFEADRIVLADETGEVVGELTGARRGVGGTTPADRPVPQAAPARVEPEPVSVEPVASPVPAVVDVLRSIAADILKFAPEELDPRTGLDAFGFASISLVAFAKEIHERFGVTISPAVFFDVNTLQALGTYLADEHGVTVEARPPRPVRVEERPEPVRAEARPEPAGDAADPRMPIAVIGAAGRFPGARDLDEYWANLVAGKDSVTAFPLHRYDENQRRTIADQDFPQRVGALDDIDAFDAGFFRILPREADLMDPQHRLALETVWQALEDSAYRPADLPTTTGVFLGVSGNDYATLLTSLGVAPDAFTATGTTHSILANRISYLLDVRGPSEPIDTACSSSLVAVHRAMEAIRSGACDMAVAGGVNVLLSTDAFVSAHRAGMLSPDGLCKTFDADANGYVRGEGVGAVVLKPLAAAERDGDAILGVLRGSACNHGGRANSLTAPNADAQAELVTTALGDLDPDTVGYLETHGTGTALGDPVEVRALRTAFRRLGRRDDGACGLGSVKTNIGHLESAAGIAGLLKVLLALKHGVLPATQHVQQVNPYIELADGPFHIVRDNEPWARPRNRDGSPAPRRAGVSSFGFGGVNAHVVVEEYVPRDQDGETAATVAVPLSARTREQLTARARDLLSYLERSDDVPLRSVAWSLQIGREEMAERVGWVVSSRAELLDRLRAFVTTGDRGSGEGPIGEWIDGATVDWRATFGGTPPRRVRLPGYPFARDRFWIPGTRHLPGTEQPSGAGRGPRTEQPGGDTQEIGTVLLTPRWTPTPAAATGRYDRRVVVLCGIDGSVPGALHLDTVKRRPESRFRDLSWQLLETVRGLDTRAGTTLVQVVTDDIALAGLLRTVAKENPRIAGQVIGLDDAGGTDVAAVVAENAEATDDLVVYRDGVRHTRTWAPAAPASTAADTPWRDGGRYLITGGAGGIGARLARRIAADVRRPTLVLAGRSPGDGRVDRLLAELRQAGADARYVRADVSRWEEVRHLVAEAGELTGIVHAAGVVRDALLADKTVEQWDEVLATKVDGLVHLDRATEHCPLEFLLTFSSGAALTGNPGQSDYATANAFLDEFAAVRNTRVAEGRRRGRTLSLAWPLWEDGGMRVDDRARAYLWEDRGLAPMPTEEGLTALLDAWHTGADQVWVHHGDPRRARQSAPAATPRPAAARPVATRPVPTADPDVLDHLLTVFAEVTGLAPGSVDPDRPLVEVGLDSMMVLQLNRELIRTHPDVSSTIFFEQPTLRGVAGQLTGHRPEPARQHSTGTTDTPTTPTVTTVTADTPTGRAEPPAAGTDEPIAIIGLSGRYPGAADPDQFWDNLRAGRDCVREVDRWPLDGFFEPDRNTAVATGRSYSKWGGFLDDFAAFDPRFFGIAPRDAYAMDPQERLFVQAAWEVLEDAGYTRARLADRHGHGVGVFAGVTKVGHARHDVGRLPSGELVVPGLSFASLSARASYLLDLRGPSLTIDTMCSASLTAIHEACEQLRRGACEVAIAGGVNLYTHPLDYVELCRSGMLSPDRHCRSFGAGGHGFVPGEGVGCVLLKPLSRAEADGDRVLAVIRGSSVNHGGRTTGYTVPSPVAQADLVRQALDRAGVHAREVSYVEAHGTGTELGDPIEITGLTTAFEQDTADRQYCAIGSVKSGIGHLEAAAGVAGLTKVLLQMRHRQLVPTLHAERLNPNITFERTPFRVQRELSPWHSEGPRIAAVSSFGAGGSNAHLIVEEYPVQPTNGPTNTAEQVVALSARTPEQLTASLDRLAGFLDRNPDTDLADLAFTLQVGREAMTERYAVAVSSTAELRTSLRAGRGHRGTVEASGGLLAEITDDGDLQELLVRRWIAAGKLSKLAALWASGVAVDWERLHQGAPRRVVSLPTYPFAKDRFWIGDLTRTAPASVAAPAAEPVVERAARPAAAPVVVEPAAVAPVAAEPAAAPPAVGRRNLDEIVPAVVREKIARALALEVAEIEGGLAFADYGLDSILAIRVVHQLNEALSLDLPTSVVFDFSTADRLTAHLLTTYRDTLAYTEGAADTASEPADAPQTTGEPVPVPVPVPVPTGRRADERVSGERGPIAVIGMSGRFAGADSLDELWTHLADGDDLVTGTTRFDLDGVSSCTRGGFLDRIDEFDAMFFNISGTEATVMDPQQRLLLEESWKALEDAGYAGQMGRRRCGVYVGAWAGDYQGLLDPDAPAQTLWGNMTSVIPSRVSYFLDLKGPAIAVDTSCSSSLVAIDLACKGLWSGETSMALAGGVFLQSTPRLYGLAGRAGMLSPTGRCHTFDHRADGFVPGEGVGVVVLKRLADALADGDHIHGVIKASGVNQDGATNGITAPSSLSQESLLREVYERFDVDVTRIGLVEAHGTGTKLGDPIEFQALDRAFRAHTDRTEYCAVGSLKTNIGHTQFAAGVAGVLKVLLALKHRQIPASLHFETANEAIPLAGSPFYLSTRTHAWEAPAGAPRCGVVSSFGASGTNAHLVLEEAPPVARTATPHRAHTVVLSARTEQQLDEQKRRLAAHLRADAAIDLGDLAFTLAVGRQRFAHRFACVVRDREELIQVLDGTVPARLPAEEPIPAEGRRIPLPTYPFARDRYWPAAAGDDRVTLTREHGLLRDHVVQGRHILPAVASLELARKAVGTVPVRMRNVTWVQPLEVADTPVEARVTVRATGRGAHRFEIATGDTVCCEGSITPSDAPRPARADLAALRADCRETVSGDRIHDALVSMGIDHGPSLRAIRQAHVGSGLVLAELALPDGAEPGVLTPAMLDSAIQSAVAAHLTGMRDTAVPFALDQLDAFAPCTPTMWAIVRGGGSGPLDKLDIDLVDADGEVCVRLTGYTSRRTVQAEPALFAPVWDPITAAEAPVPSGTDRVLVVGGPAPFDTALTWPLPPSATVEEATAALRALGPVDHLVWAAPETKLEPTDAPGHVAAQNDGVVAAFRMIKALLAAGYDARPLGITLVTIRALATHAHDAVQPAHAGLHGLFGSLGREYGQWTVRRVDLDTPEWPADLTALPAQSPDDAWARRAGQWLARHWAPCAAPAKPVYREGGVYVVIGGAGGLGTAWTQHVVQHFGAHVTWIGRSAHDASVDDKLRAITGRGTVRYLSADAGDPAALRRAVAEVRQRHPRIDGVVQAALVLRDSTFARMDEATLRAGLAAKIDVTTAMAEVFDGEPLDFAVLLSSMQSFTTAAGQGNYAAGCTFSDAYAHALGQHWDTPVKVMNWGWWGDRGSVTSAFYRERLSRVGLVSIEPHEGLAALDTLLGGDQRQLAFIKTNQHNTLANFDRGTQVTVHEPTPSRVRGELLLTSDGVDGRMDGVVRWRRTERDPWLAKVLAAQLASLDHGEILPLYADWLAHAEQVGVPAEPVEVVLAQWDRQCELWSTDAHRTAELRLVSATLRALPDVLTGRIRPTDVIFPRGSMELVEGCYRDNPAADLFNQAMARAAVDIVTERLRHEPGARLRILEIGAGTGGTSSGMFAALKPYQDSIESYVYTDLSKAFLNHARATYGPDVPYLDCRLLNIEQPLAGQDVAEGGFDLVIAANVLHATRDTRNTLRNAKAALRAGGWLLLNELSAFDLFSHLTFGLLEGWWLFDDRSLRIPGSPALSPESWRDVLTGEGFGTVVFPLSQALPLGQQVIAAESDGVARQGLAGAAKGRARQGTSTPKAGARPGAGGAERTVQAPRSEPAPAPVSGTAVVAPEAAPVPAPRPAPAPVVSPEPAPAATPAAVSDPSAVILDKAAAVLGIPADRIDTSARLTDYGLDSILVLQLTNALREEFGDDVSSTLLFEVESIDGLCAHFAGPAGERWNLSRGQLTMYRDQRRCPESTAYHLPLLFEIHGDLDEAALERAIRAQTALHPVLSAVLGERDGEPYLDIDPTRVPSFERIDIAAASRVAQLARLRELVNIPFDLATGPLVRTHLVTLPGRRRLLMITAHHILLDGTSTAVLVRTLKDAYRGGGNPSRAAYGDFVAWEEALLTGPRAARHRDYWVGELAAPRRALALPYDRPYDPERLPRVDTVTFTLPPALATALADTAREHRVSVATVLFATYARFLHELTGQDDLILGMTAAARYEQRFQDVVGQFANCLPIRCAVTGGLPELLGPLQRKVVAGIEHGAYPLLEITRALGAEDEPLVLTNFLFQNFDGAELLTNDAPAGQGELDLRRFDDLPYAGEYVLSAEFYREGAGYKVFLKYDTHVFNEATARRMRDEWHAIIRDELGRHGGTAEPDA
ncbi:polyketide synthase family protein [Streptomyces noursei ATCC 11455]|uniref:SDR family NAD(P)-dependent oxidoreductase n=1 Tax=Streptomyces noursei TaxID=1971 RepID=UPI00081CD0F6|nr:polyketide synthase family protein [Streptomyces noursei ATCC 11455]